MEHARNQNYKMAASETWRKATWQSPGHCEEQNDVAIYYDYRELEIASSAIISGLATMWVLCKRLE